MQQFRRLSKMKNQFQNYFKLNININDIKKSCNNIIIIREKKKRENLDNMNFNS